MEGTEEEGTVLRSRHGAPTREPGRGGLTQTSVRCTVKFKKVCCSPLCQRVA